MLFEFNCIKHTYRLLLGFRAELQIDGMLALHLCKFRNRDSHIDRSGQHIGLEVDPADLYAALRSPRAVGHDCDGSVDTFRYKVKDKVQLPAAICTVKIEIFVSDYSAVGVVHNRVCIVPEVIWSFELVIRTVTGCHI